LVIDDPDAAWAVGGVRTPAGSLDSLDEMPRESLGVRQSQFDAVLAVIGRHRDDNGVS
jgi:hypothetical protein